jgi:hypothetical protein
MKATESGSFKTVPLPAEGTYVARCYSVIHIGTVPNIYEGKLKGTKETVQVTWELPKLKAVFNEEKGPEPFVVGLELTLSTSENSNLAKLIGQWRGKKFTPEEQKGFDPSIMVGKTCLINVIHSRKKKYVGQQIDEINNGNTVLKFNGIMARPKEMECPDMCNPKYIWDWEKDGNPFQTEKFGLMPRWLQDKVKESEEFKKLGPKDQPASSGSGALQPGPSSSPAPKVDDGDGW